MGNGSDGRRRPPRQVVWECVAGLLLCYLLGVVVLALAPQYPWPVRSLLMDLRSLAVALPVGLVAVVWHVRLRRPELLRTATRLYFGAFALRVMVLMVLVSVSWTIEPGLHGQPSDDCVLYYRFARTALVVAGREDPTWQADSAPFMASGDPRIFREPVQFMAQWPWLVALTGYGWLVGHSAVAMTLPLLALSCFFIVQLWLYLLDACSRRTAAMAVLWCLLLPDQHVLAAGMLKDFGTGIGLLLLCEFGSSERVRRPRPEWLQFLLIPLWLAIWRPDFLLIAPPLMIALRLRRLASEDRRRQVDWLLLAAAFVVAAVLSRMSVYAGGYGAGRPVNTASYYGGVFGGLALVPPVKISVTACTRNIYLMGIADLPTSLLWPFVVALGATGLAYGRRLAVRFEGGAGMVIWFWQVLIAASGVAVNHKYRAPLDPLIVAYALETVWAMQRARPALQQRAIRLAAGLTAVLFAVQLGVVVLFDIGR